MNLDLVRRTERFLKDRFEEAQYLGSHPLEKAYRLEHTYRVANIGREIASREGFDETEMVIACLLHDVAYCEDFGEDGWKEHGRRGARIARPFLESLGLPGDRIEDICYGIAIHVDDEADFPGERTPFALSVGDADNIDRFDAYRIHEILSKDNYLEMGLEEKRSYLAAKLEKLRKCLMMPTGTKTARILWETRVNDYISFYDRLSAQAEASSEILDLERSRL
ncbi:MAG: HD domain-containing protein [Clostridia bacterium]|nr:HD domain-containing protein [Clostridia bacterium]